MYIKIITEEGEQFFPCAEIDNQAGSIVIKRVDQSLMVIEKSEYKRLDVFVLNNEGKTIDAYYKNREVVEI